MKLNKIAVKSLFGIFDHEIPLNDNGITIVIGENGLGKTVILEAVYAFFKEDYRFFCDLEFSKFVFYFEDNEYWDVTKTSNNSQFTLNVNRRYIDKDTKTKPIKIAELDLNEKSSKRHQNRDLILNYEMAKHRALLLNDNRRRHLDEYINSEEYALSRYLSDTHVQRLLFNSDDKTLPKWFSEKIKAIKVNLIETQRTITAKERGSDAYINTVLKCSKELTEQISIVEKSSSETTTELDSTYPNRLLQKIKQKTVDSFDELNTALLKLDERRKVISSIGLIESTHDSDLLQITENQQDLINALKLYIDDSHKKLKPFDEISNKISLFLQIVNKRFKHKTLAINKNNGFVFRSTVKIGKDGQLEEISPLKLSSGEQNELILFYELIFKSSPGDLILIDEPELSLHISWQNKFINDLKEVTSINRVSIIIATHSPDIIDENWDLKVELQGIE